ncbi:hypothetical protein ABPG72_014505 [Tetrahymena utriculariae]
MDQEKKQSKCNIHPTFNNNLLIFEENNIHTKNCSVCAKQITENFNKIIEHDEFIHADQNHIFSSFPPLEDKNIYNTIKSLQIKKDSSNQEKFIEKINNYFISLKKEINQKIDNLQNQVKSKLLQIQNSIENQGDIYNELYKKIKQKNFSEYKAIINKINLKTSKEIQEKISGLIDQIDFFEKSQKDIIDNVEFEKSKFYQGSQNLQIQRLQNKHIQINQSVVNYGVSYANFILDPDQKYIFRVKLQTHSMPDAFLIVGIIQEEDKDNKQLYDEICYNETGNNMTIKKVIKGNNVYERQKINMDEEIEMRIHLASKTIKVANYPNYENVAELENKQLILENKQYRLAVELFFTPHKIIILLYQQSMYLIKKCEFHLIKTTK